MPISIHVRGPHVDGGEAAKTVAEAFAQLRRADELFSTYRCDSLVNRLRRGELGLDDCDPLVREVAAACQQAEELTDGWFTARLPGTDGSLGFDPTGLVKGWAADRAAALLAALPAHTFCLNAGGDVVVGGDAGTPDGEDPPAPWRVGVEDPRDRSQIARVLQLDRGGVATSGTAARGAHLYDPRSARHVSREGSVTVTGPDLMWADVWATALFVGPPDLAGRFTRLAAGYEAIPL